MTEHIAPTALGLDLVRAMKAAIASENGAGFAALTHRLPIRSPDEPAPLTFTIDLTQDQDGLFLVTCRELPEVVTAAEDESLAVSLVQLEIMAALVQRRADRRSEMRASGP